MITYDFRRCVILWQDFEGESHELPAEICWDEEYNTWLEPDKEKCDPALVEKFFDERELIEDIQKI